MIVICAVRAYTVNHSTFDVAMTMFFGVFGYLFERLKYPLAPPVRVLVLMPAGVAEASCRETLLLPQGRVHRREARSAASAP